MASTGSKGVSTSGGRRWKGLSRGELAWLLVFCCLGIALFLLFLGYYGGASGAVLVREFESYQLARNLSQGRGFTTDVVYPLCLKLYGGDIARYPDMFSAPLFPFLLSVFFFFFGAQDATVLLFGAALYLCGGVVVFLVARQIYDFKVAAVSTLLYLCNFQLLDSAIRSQSILVTAIMVTLLLFSLRGGSSSRGSLAFSGAVLGLVYLSRYELLLAFLPPSIALVWLFSDENKAANLAWFLLPFAVISFPFMLRNQALTGYPLYGLALGRAWRNQEALTLFMDAKILFFSWSKFFFSYQYFFPQLLTTGGTYISVFAIVGVLLRGRSRDRNLLLCVLVILFLYFSIQLATGPYWAAYSLFFLPFFAILGTRGFFYLTAWVSERRLLGGVFLAVFLLFNLIPLAKLVTFPEPWHLDHGCFRRLIKAEEGDRIVVTDAAGVASWYGNLTIVKLPGRPEGFYLLQEEHPAADSIFFSVFNFAADWPPDTNPGDWAPFYAAVVDGFLPERLLSGTVRFDPRGNTYLYGVKVSEPPVKRDRRDRASGGARDF